MELLIAVGILGILSAGMATLMINQQKESRALQETFARMDLEKSLLSSLANGSICTFILNHSSQGPTSSTPNRDRNVFDSNGVTSSQPLIIKIQNLLASPSESAPSLARVGERASALSNNLIVSDMRFVIRPNLPPDVFLADFEVSFRENMTVRAPRKIVIKNIQIATDSGTPLNAKEIIGCSGWGEPRARRFTFTSSTTWTVPVDTRRAFITMAGGGSSGMSWRVVNSVQAGHSGGYVFSQPVNLVPGEKLQIIIGRGGKGVSTIRTATIADIGLPHYVWTNPPGEDGLSGYPGESTKVISPSQGTLLECTGGSGTYPGGVDSYTGSPVAGNVPGATVGSGNPPLPAPNRMATGPWVSSDGPGACGPDLYGIGNRGVKVWEPSSGDYMGGATPFGYGSGGLISRYGCWVTPNTMGTCVSAGPGRDGVVFIDVW
ncbi:hypothetical protein [Bdellovibrio bacteriovorus]|uniref:hypothetical protein n=1 Tax=Bdellovibrio bacteriovorus TaxID=959 RepID=UPI0035A6DA9F